MCVSARADLDDTYTQSLVRCAEPGTVEKGYCLAGETGASAETKKLMNKMS